MNGSNLFYNVGIGHNNPINTFVVGDGDKYQVRGADGDYLLSLRTGKVRMTEKLVLLR